MKKKAVKCGLQDTAWYCTHQLLRPSQNQAHQNSYMSKIKVSETPSLQGEVDNLLWGYGC